MRRTARALLWGLACPASVYAATLSLDSSVAKLSPLAALMVLVLSTVFGLAALLNVLKQETPPRLLAYISAHMLTSWGAGAIAFVIGEWREWDDWFVVALVMVASYGGVRVLDAARDRMLRRIESDGPPSPSATPGVPPVKPL